MNDLQIKSKGISQARYTRVRYLLYLSAVWHFFYFFVTIFLSFSLRGFNGQNSSYKEIQTFPQGNGQENHMHIPTLEAFPIFPPHPKFYLKKEQVKNGHL
jgi:hypothetical protein